MSAWDKAIARDSRFVEADYERAAYRLISHQVLSAMDKATRNDYFLVHQNLSDFVQVIAPLGVEIIHDSHYQYVVAKPRHVLNPHRANKQVTLMVLVLANIHHTVRFEGSEGEFGEAYVELPALQEAWEGLTGRPWLKHGDLRALLAELDRWGIAAEQKTEADDPQPFRVVIHPAISAIVSKEWLHQLDAFRKETENDADEEMSAESDDVSS